MKRLLSIALTLTFVIAIAACGRTPADLSILEDITLSIGDFTVEAARLPHDFEQTRLEAVSLNSLGEERHVVAYGVLLETLLQEQGLSQRDFASAVALGYDGYSIAVPSEILHGREILLAFEFNGEFIEPRIVIPEERAMYWVKYLREIELIVHAEETEVTREVAFEDILTALADYAEDFKYYDADTQALPIARLLDYLDAERVDFVTMTAADGLVKTERFSTFSQQLLVFDGTEDAPLFIGPNLPIGMRVRHLVSIQIGETLVVM